MSVNLFAYFEVGRRALEASQAALDVAGVNIANINTPGFSRRRLDLTTVFPQSVPGGFLGQGVNVADLHRVRDRLLSGQIVFSLGTTAGMEERQRSLSIVESVLGSVEASPIVDGMNALSRTLTDVSSQPENRAARQVAVDTAATLAAQIRTAYGQLERERQATDQEITDVSSQINRLTQAIAQLNKGVRAQEATGHEASDLRDQRDLKIEQLAGLVDIHVIVNSDNTVGVALAAGGTALVTSDKAFQLVTEPDGNGLSRVIVDIPGARTDVTGVVKGGQLGGLLAARDVVAATVQAELDQLATDLVTRFNAVHATGFDLSGAPGGAFFSVSAVPGVSAAASIDVDAALAADPSLLAASATGAVGDGVIAAALADVTTTSSATLGGMSSVGFFSTIVARVGGDVAATDAVLASEGQVLAGLQDLNDSVSGVSLDEEAISLIQFQRSYEAAARFVRVLDEITRIALTLGS